MATFCVCLVFDMGWDVGVEVISRNGTVAKKKFLVILFFYCSDVLFQKPQ